MKISTSKVSTSNIYIHIYTSKKTQNSNGPKICGHHLRPISILWISVCGVFWKKKPVLHSITIWRIASLYSSRSETPCYYTDGGHFESDFFMFMELCSSFVDLTFCQVSRELLYIIYIYI